MTAPRPRSATLRVAAAQATSAPGEVTANVTTAVSLLDAAAARGARLLVLPELFLTGYDPATWSPETALTTDDRRLAPLRETSARYDVVVVAGVAVRRTDDASAGSVTLSLLVVDPRGEVTAPYDKQHLFDTEQKHFTAGDHGASVVIDGWELGLGICYDGCFPEHAAAAARDGATAYLCPAAYFTGSEHRRDLYYAAEVARVQEQNPLERDRLPSLGSRTRLTLGAP